MSECFTLVLLFSHRATLLLFCVSHFFHSFLIRLHPEPDWKALGCDVNPDDAPPLIAAEATDANENSDDDEDAEALKRTGE